MILVNNETKQSRFRIGSKIASVILTGALLATSFTGLGSSLIPATSTEVYAAGSYGLADRIEDGNILHCFNWSISDITAAIPEIAEAGFTSVQTSPVQPHDGQGIWYWLYQPLGFSVGNDIGSAEDIKALCAKAHEYGVKVIVDVVANHLAGWADGRRNANVDSSLAADEYYHNTEFNTDAKNVDWSNRWQVTHCNIGMPDLNSEHATVQSKVASFVNDLKACGVDGIRWDAAKHIGLPSEDCNFWPAVTAAGLYNYGEILDGPTNSGGDEKMVEYTNYIGVTDDNYSGEITGSIRDGSATQNTGKWANRGVSASKIVYWPESHDTYCNNGWTNGLSENVMDRAYAVTGARANSQTLYLSRPFEKEHEKICYNRKGSTHFTEKQVSEVNKFKNANVGTNEYLTTAENCYVICRGKGAVVVNASGGGKQVTVPNGGGLVPEGTYTDAVGGGTWTVTSTTMSGSIGDTGIAVFYKGGDLPTPSGSVSVSPTSGSFTDTMSVTVTASTGISNASYSATDGTSGTFSGSKTISLGSSTAVGGSVTLTVKGTNSEGKEVTATGTYTKKDPSATVTVNVDNSVGNWSKVYAYVYKGAGGEGNQNAKWPGIEMTKGSKYYTLDVTGFEQGYAIFSDGNDDASKRYPAEGAQGLSIGGSSKLFTMPNKWEELPSDPIPVPDVPTVTVDKASGSSFTSETQTIKLTLSNGTKGTYKVDNGPEKEFTGTASVVIGEGKIGDSTIKVDTTAVGSDGTKKSYSFSYEKKYTVKTSSSSAGTLSSYYSTNAAGKGAKKTITVDGDISDWDSSMIIAQGAANDDPRVYRPNSMFELPLDLYTLYGAHDDNNIYLMWEMTNVQDIVAPNDDYPLTQGILYQTMNIPFFIAVNTGKSDTIGNKCQTAAGGTLWDSGITFSNSDGVNRLIAISTNGANGPYVYKGDSSGLNAVEVYGPVASAKTNTEKSGIQFNYGLGILSSKVNGIDGAYGVNNNRVVGDMCGESAAWVDFNAKGHKTTTMDFHYEMSIPLSELGVTSSDVASSGVGVMVIMTSGKSGMDCLPYDLSMNDQADLDDSAGSLENNSFEKSDADNITVGFARIGAGSSPTPTPTPTPTPGTPLQVNFGADRSAPQLTTTALTLKGIGIGGTSPYKYEFYVDGTKVQASSTTDTYTWTPGTAKQHTIKCIVTDSTGATAESSKTFTAEGTDSPIPTPTALVNNSKISATTINKGASVKLTGAASGGTTPYQFAYVVKSPSGSWTVLKDYSTATSHTWTPASTGTYTVQIKAKDSAGQVEVSSFTLKVNSTAALTNNSKISATTIAKGTAVKMTGAASGGTTPYKYAYVVQAPNGNWTVLKDYSTATTHTWTPASTGKYTVQIKVKDAKNTVVVKSYTLTVSNALVNNSKISATSITKGTTLKLTGAASGGTTPYKYAYVAKTPAGEWKVIKDYSTSTSHSWTPASVGTYTVQIKVKDAKNTVVVKSFTLKVSATLVNNSKISATSITKGTAVKITGAASGGTTPYKYAYVVKAPNGNWTVLKDYSTATTHTWTPASTGKYTVQVKVKDAKNTVVVKSFTLTVSAALVNNSKISATSITKGTTIKLTGAASGGTTPYKYAYVAKTPAGEWKVIKDYSTSTSHSWTPASTGKYTVQVKVKDAKNTIVVKSFNLEVLTPLTNTSKMSATTISKGSSVKLTGSATGSTGYYQYAFVTKAPNGNWYVLQDYSTTATYTFKPSSTGKYTVQIKVKDNKNNVKVKEFTLTVNTELVNTSKISATSITKGSSVKITGSATGSTGFYQYAYVAKTPAGEWKVLRNYSTTATHTWTPASTGTYTVQVKVKDSVGTIKIKSFTLKVSTALVNNSKISATSITKGTTLKLTGAASGGTTPYKFAYVAKTPAGEWKVIKDYSTSTTHSWTPASVGTYTVQIKVKDAKNTVVVKSFTLKVSAAALTNNSKISATSITKGTTIKLTGAASGGTSPYQYAYVAKTPAGEWKIIKDYSTSTTHSWTPASKGTYTVQIKVKDKNSTVVPKSFTLKVS